MSLVYYDIAVQVLSKCSDEVRNEILGLRLYPIVEAKCREHAPKVTGMLLEMEVSELLYLLGSPVDLNEKIKEALKLLEGDDEVLPTCGLTVSLYSHDGECVPSKEKCEYCYKYWCGKCGNGLSNYLVKCCDD